MSTSKLTKWWLLGTTLALSLSLLIACSGSSNYKDYFPQRDGMSKRYKMSISVPGQGVQEFWATERVDGKEKVNGKDYFKFVQVYEGMPGMEPSFDLRRIDEKGVWLIDGDNIDGPENLVVPFDLEEGSQWTVSTDDSDLQYEFKGTQDLILPAKTYDDCLLITYSGIQSGEFLDAASYYCKNIGEAKLTANMGGISIELVLAEN